MVCSQSFISWVTESEELISYFKKWNNPSFWIMEGHSAGLLYFPLPIQKNQKWHFLQLLFLWWLYWNGCPSLLALSIYKYIFIRSNIYNKCVLFWKDVILGFIEYEQSKRKQFYVVNLILLLAKFHIHRYKYSNSRPHFFVFMKEFEQYLSLIQLSKNKKALKLYLPVTLFLPLMTCDSQFYRLSF